MFLWMEVRISPRLDAVITDLREQIFDVAVHSRFLDRDIRTSQLLVECRCHSDHDSYQGWAFPEGTSKRRGETRFHPHGRVSLSFGLLVAEEDIARLTAHELRHIAQFQRGLKSWGFLTANHMGDEHEPDAYAFEDLVLDRMGLLAVC